MLHRKSQNCDKLKEQSFGVEGIIKVMQNKIDVGLFMNELANRSGFKNLNVSSFEGENLLANIAVELFSTSHPSSSEFQKKSKIPLGELAIS